MPENHQPEVARLFVAISLPGALRLVLGKVQERLRQALPGHGLRWTRAEQMHLTLKFLGDVEISRLEALSAALTETCVDFAPLSLRAEGLGLFPRAASPRVVWVGIADGGEQLVRLQASVEAAVGPFGPEERGDVFKAHVTLARVKDITHREVSILREQITLAKDRCFGEWTAGQVDLIQSQLLQSGPRYTLLASAALTGRP